MAVSYRRAAATNSSLIIASFSSGKTSLRTRSKVVAVAHRSMHRTLCLFFTMVDRLHGRGRGTSAPRRDRAFCVMYKK